MSTCSLASFKVFREKLVHQKVKKHTKNDHSATKQCWENQVLRGQVSFKSINSRCFVK